MHPRPQDVLIFFNDSYFFIIILAAFLALLDAAANKDGEDDAESSTKAKAHPLQLMEEKLKAADLRAQPAKGS